MRTWWVLLILAGLLALLRAADRVCAQEPTPPGVVKTPSPAVEEVKPSGLYLRNEKGELVYVPDISYEQFEQMLKVQRNLANPQRPAFVMADMAMDASVVGNRLELDVEFTLQGQSLEGVAKGTWFHVPLRCDNAVLRKEPVFEGPGGHFLTFDGGQDGYVCWLQSGDEVDAQGDASLADAGRASGGRIARHAVGPDALGVHAAPADRGEIGRRGRAGHGGRRGSSAGLRNDAGRAGAACGSRNSRQCRAQLAGVAVGGLSR